jgi:hypothetical protein
MPYSQDLAKSARRHLTAAGYLYADEKPGTRPGNRAVAGYLFGLAGELALKRIMQQRGIRQLPEAEKSEDPMFAHFPRLKTLLRDSLEGRRHADLLKYARDSGLFREWDTKMRYAPTTDIPENLTVLWKSQAEALVDDMGT